MSNLTFTEVNKKENSDWILNRKRFSDLTHADIIAVDFVFHDLNNSYFEEVDGSNTSFKNDTRYTSWYNDKCYIQDDIFKVIVNDVYYLLEHIYITTNNNIILVVVKPKDIWDEDDVLQEEKEELDFIYFEVTY